MSLWDLGVIRVWNALCTLPSFFAFLLWVCTRPPPVWSINCRFYTAGPSHHGTAVYSPCLLYCRPQQVTFWNAVPISVQGSSEIWHMERNESGSLSSLRNGFSACVSTSPFPQVMNKQIFCLVFSFILYLLSHSKQNQEQNGCANAEAGSVVKLV